MKLGLTLILLFYFVLLFVVNKWRAARNLSHLLRMPQNTGWRVGGVVLFLSVYSISSAGLVSAIVTEKGPADLLIIWASLIPLGFLPMVFAPLWAKLNFISENEFLTLRYAQPWASRLRRFRAFYVGGLVVPILLAFSVLAFSDVLMTFFMFEKAAAIAIVAGAMALNAWRTSYRAKSVVDVVHFAAFLIPLVFVAMGFVGKPYAFAPNLTDASLLPDPIALVAFIGVQWWSAQIIDGSGIEAQQLMGIKRRRAIMASLTMGVLTVAVSSLVVFIAVHSASMGIEPGQQAYLVVVQQRLPDVLKPVMAIGLLGIFLSTFEAVQLWGSGLLLSGIYGELNRKASVVPSRLIMMGTALLAGWIAFYADELTVLLELLLGLTAGVGLVYIVRWFWWRINAQVQLMAMLLPILLVALHKGLPLVFSELEWISKLEYPKMLLVYTALSLLVVAVFVWMTNSESDRESYTRFSDRVELQRHSVLPSLGKALLFGFALFAAQVLVVWMIVR